MHAHTQGEREGSFCFSFVLKTISYFYIVFPARFYSCNNDFQKCVGGCFSEIFPFPNRKAIEELLKEAKRGKTRAETMGPMGWMKCPLAGTNKRFLINTIKNTLPSHKEQDHEQKEGNKEPGQSQDQKETNSKKHRSHSSKRSLHSARSSPPRKRASRDKRDSRASRR